MVLAASIQPAAVFDVDLPAGRTTLHASLLDAAGDEIAGGYYFGVNRQ